MKKPEMKLRRAANNAERDLDAWIRGYDDGPHMRNLPRNQHLYPRESSEARNHDEGWDVNQHYTLGGTYEELLSGNLRGPDKTL